MAATQTRYTPEDLLKITDRPMPELVDGQLVERGLSQMADAVAVNVASILRSYAESHLPGLWNGSQCGYQIFRDPERVRASSVSFTRRERLLEPLGAVGHARVARIMSWRSSFRPISLPTYGARCTTSYALVCH